MEEYISHIKMYKISVHYKKYILYKIALSERTKAIVLHDHQEY